MQESTDRNPMPSYSNPPVVETILGVQFEPLPNFRSAHLGAFWKALGSAEWPVVLDAAPLPPQFERFEESAGWGQIGLQFMVSADSSVRMQLKNQKRDRMIQVQNGRLFFNWIKLIDEEYPRYEQVRDGFRTALERFTEFVAAEKLGNFRPNQWEVIYQNHIPKGTVWNTLADWHVFKPFGSVPTVEGLIRGEGFNGQWQFVIPEHRGRLYVQWQHVKKAAPEPNELVVLTLTARGPLEPGIQDLSTILAGVDLGRETIVRSFAQMMSADANTYWGLS